MDPKLIDQYRYMLLFGADVWENVVINAQLKEKTHKRYNSDISINGFPDKPGWWRAAVGECGERAYYQWLGVDFDKVDHKKYHGLPWDAEDKTEVKTTTRSDRNLLIPKRHWHGQNAPDSYVLCHVVIFENPRFVRVGIFGRIRRDVAFKRKDLRLVENALIANPSYEIPRELLGPL